MVHGLDTIAKLNAQQEPSVVENSTVEHLRQTIIKHMKKEDRVDKSIDWNEGFNDCCKFFLGQIRIAEGK